MATRDELEQMFLQFYPTSNPAMLDDQDLAAHIAAANTRQQVQTGLPASPIQLPQTTSAPAAQYISDVIAQVAKPLSSYTPTPASASSPTNAYQPPTSTRSLLPAVAQEPVIDTSVTGGGSGVPSSRDVVGTTTRTGTVATVPDVRFTPTQPTASPVTIPSGINYNPNMGLIGANLGTPNLFITPEGGFNFGATAGMYDTLVKSLFPSWMNALAGGLEGQMQLNRYLFQNYPGQMQQLILSGLSNLGGAGTDLLQSGLAGLGQFLPVMQGNINYINQYGLPGSQLLQQQQAGLTNLANQLLGGAGQYGLTNLLQQIMQSGVPNQRAVEALVPSQQQFGQQMQQAYADLLGRMAAGQGIPQTGLNAQLSNVLQSAITGGGLTPEYVSAMRDLVLQPSQEALLGNINRMAGGSALLTSPAYQELLRRNEQQFNNMLIAQGMQNLQNYLQQAASLGGQQFGQAAQLAGLYGGGAQQGLANALSAFGAVPAAVSPFTSLAGGLTSDLLGQALQNYATGNALGLNALNTISNLAYQPLTVGAGLLQGATGQTANYLQNYINQLLAGTGQQADLATALGGQLGGLTSNLLSAMLGQMAIRQQAEQAQQSGIGQAIASILTALAAAGI